MGAGLRATRNTAMISRITFITLVGAILVVVIPIFVGMACTPGPGLVVLPDVPEESHRVWVIAAGWHTAIVIEQPEGWRFGPPEQEDAPFVEFAWGERRWYMEDRQDRPLRTLFWPTESVVFVRARPRPPAGETFHLLQERRISGDVLHTLVRSLEEEIQRKETGERVDPHPSVDWTHGTFYPGRRPYLIWHNSNAWVVHRLRDAGLTRRGILPLFFASQIDSRLDEEWK